MQYKTPPRAALKGINPKAEVYMIWATPKDAIPCKKYWGHTSRASPKHENASPNKILREKAYLKLKPFYNFFNVYIFKKLYNYTNWYNFLLFTCKLSAILLKLYCIVYWVQMDYILFVKKACDYFLSFLSKHSPAFWKVSF